MARKSNEVEEAPGDAEGARRATVASPGGAVVTGPLGPGQRWSRARKREVVLRLLRGESTEAVSRELRVEVVRLEQWRTQALAAIDAAVRERGEPAESEALGEAMKRIGALTMENELLRERCRAREANLPLASRRSWR